MLQDRLGLDFSGVSSGDAAVGGRGLRLLDVLSDDAVVGSCNRTVRR